MESKMDKYWRRELEECFEKMGIDKYKETLISKFRRIRHLREKKIRLEYARRRDRKKFISSLEKIKMKMAEQQWNHLCHIQERTARREKKRLLYLMRIQQQYNLQVGVIPLDNPIFSKIIEWRREQKKKAQARKRRMIEIIKKISSELNGRYVRTIKPMTASEWYLTMKRSTSGEASYGTFDTTAEEEAEAFPRSIKRSEENMEKVSPETLTSKEKLTDKSETTDLKNEYEEEVGTEEKEELEEFSSEYRSTIKTEYSGSVKIEKELPKDTCFYSNPEKVEFKNFQAGRVYNRKVSIFNKSFRRAYIRYHKLDIDVWEPVIEIEAYSALRIDPGMHEKINIKFCPVHDDEVNATAYFLSLSHKGSTEYHEFSIPIHCTPEMPIPVVSPTELRFPSSPIWNTKLSQRILTISNKGGKSFTLLIAKKNREENYFLWTFEQAELSSADLTNDSVENISALYDDESSDTTYNLLVEEQKRYVSISSRQQRIEVPPDFSCRLRITFYPKYVGLHFDVIELSFECNDKTFGKQEVPVWAEATGLQVYVNPTCVDLGIIMIDSGMYQENFEVINTGLKFFIRRVLANVVLKVPKSLRDQMFLYPKNIFIQPESTCTITVRLVPQPNIVKKCKRYYSSISSMLEIPVQIKPASPEMTNAPPLILKVLATLTTARALVLEPSRIMFGQVHTNESVLAKLTLTNASLITHEYAFLNLPTFMEVQPAYGFGTILPGESIPLHLIYSPWLTDIPGNDSEANGLAGKQRFLVRVVTLAEFAAGTSKPQVSKIKEPYTRQLQKPRNYGVPFAAEVVKQEKRKVTENFVDHVKKEFLHQCAITEHDRSLEEIENVSISDDDSSSYDRRADRRREKNVIEVFAYIVDTFCELSEQICEFAATPCGCFSTLSIDLRGFNTASYPNCTCGLLKNQVKEFTATYEFLCSSRHIKVIPQSGKLKSNEVVKITFVFEPKLPKHATLTTAEEEKAEKLMEELEKLKERSMTEEASTNNSSNVRSKEQSAKRKETIGERSAIVEQLSLLEAFRPRVTTAYVECNLQVALTNESSREEKLLAKLSCPVVKPDILILNSSREIQFKPTRIGETTRELLFVKNISNREVEVRVTLLDPFGPFFMAAGKVIEAGSILTLPISYRPTESDPSPIEEFFEVSAVGTRTWWRMAVSATALPPA